jgi:hypothetical protein
VTVIYPRTVYAVRHLMTALVGAGYTPCFHPSTLSITVPCETQDVPSEVRFSSTVEALDSTGEARY